MAMYFVRHDSMTQATTTFAPVETGSDGSTAGPIRIPTTVKRITNIRCGAVVDGAHTTNTGTVYVIRLTGTNALKNGQQDLVVAAEMLADGGGTLTYTDTQLVFPTNIKCDIEVIAGSDLTVQAAYYGTDPGSPQISVELEFQ